MVLFFKNIANWLQANELTCPVKKLMGFDCPGCGMQRSLVALLQGHFELSIKYHPVTIPLLLFLFYGLLHVFFKFKNGNKIIIYSYTSVTIMMVTNYIYKIIHLN
jgi:hypothetical protein